MFVSGICQKILVSRLDKYPSPVGGSGNFSSLSTSIFWQIPLTSMVYFYKILVERLDKFPEPIVEGYLSSLETSIFWQIPLTSMVYFYNSTEYVVTIT